MAKAALQSALAFAVLLICTGCGTDRVAGTSSETTNTAALTGQVRTPDGLPAGEARLTLRPEAYLADTSGAPRMPERGAADLKTDSLGRFRIDSLPPGTYALSFREGGESPLAGLIRVRLTGDAREGDLGALQLQPGATLAGRIEPPAGAGARAYVQLAGLERMARGDDSGRFRLEDVPAGMHRLRFIGSSPALDPEFRTISAAPGESLDVGTIALSSFEGEDYSRWPSSRRIHFDAGTLDSLSDAVTDFPLLVRLDSSSLNFATVEPASLRFSDPEGKHLRYHVQAWDTVARRGEVWVALESVPAGAAGFAVTLHWGLPGAHDWSDAASVFGAGQGFAAAWHLDEEKAGAGAADVYNDASGGGNAGEDRILSPAQDGLSGRCPAFLAGDYMKVPSASPALRPERAFLLSAWVRSSGADTLAGTVLGLGEYYGFRIQPDGEILFSVARANRTYVRLKTTGAGLRDGGWHQIACQLDRDTLLIHLDGREVAREHHPAKPAYPSGLGTDFHIGVLGDGKMSFPFLGLIDEVQISGAGRSRDWIRLQFENMRPGSDLLRFE